MKENNKYLLKNWIKTVLVYLVSIIIMVRSIIINPYNIFCWLLVFVFVLLTVFLRRRSVKDKIDECLKAETSDCLIRYYDKMYRKVFMYRDKDVIVCYVKANAHCYYGEYQEALKLLSTINWDEKVEYYQSINLLTRALIHYLTKENIEEGLNYARRAKQLGEMSKKFPKATIAMEGYDTYIQMGELLSGDYNDETISNLERKFSTGPVGHKLLIGWCLSNIYSKIGNIERAQVMHEYCIKTAPYCKPLHNNIL